VPLDFAVTYEWHLSALHPDDRQRVIDSTVTALRDRVEFDEEYRTVDGAGNIRWIRAKGRGYYDEANQPYRMSGTVLDIGDRQVALQARQQAEAALVQNQERMTLALQSTGLAVWDWYPLTGEIWASEQFYEAVGLEVQEAIPSVEEWIERHVHPDDRDWVRQTWRTVLAQKQPKFVAEYRILHPMGVRWIADQSQLYYRVQPDQESADQTLRDQAQISCLSDNPAVLNAISDSTSDAISDGIEPPGAESRMNAEVDLARKSLYRISNSKFGMYQEILTNLQ
jgi:PAS domain-containing protein